MKKAHIALLIAIISIAASALVSCGKETTATTGTLTIKGAGV